MQQATGAMERVSELFDEPVTIENKPGAKPLPPLSKEIRLENVTFRYGGSREAAGPQAAKPQPLGPRPRGRRLEGRPA